MLTIIIPKQEIETYNSQTRTFSKYGLDHDYEICLEHSLVSISKWESKWHKPFLDDKNKTNEELVDYVKCMTISQNVDPKVYNFLTKKNFEDINAYIGDSHTATTLTVKKKAGGVKTSQFTTSELIYSWMIGLQIPFECQKWHLNRLLTLIRVCNANNNPDQNKMSKSDVRNKYRSLNAARRAKKPH